MSEPTNDATPLPVTEPSTITERVRAHAHNAAPRATRRRGRILIAGLVVAGVFAAGAAFAGRRNPSDSAIRERVSWAMEKAIDRLDGTDEQLVAMETIVDAHFPAALKLRQEGRELRMKLAEALLADAPDPVVIEKLRTQLVALVDRATVELSAALQEGTGVLTPEQRKAILQKLADRFAS